MEWNASARFRTHTELNPPPPPHDHPTGTMATTAPTFEAIYDIDLALTAAGKWSPSPFVVPLLWCELNSVVAFCTTPPAPRAHRLTHPHAHNTEDARDEPEQQQQAQTHYETLVQVLAQAATSYVEHRVLSVAFTLVGRHAGLVPALTPQAATTVVGLLGLAPSMEEKMTPSVCKSAAGALVKLAQVVAASYPSASCDTICGEIQTLLAQPGQEGVAKELAKAKGILEAAVGEPEKEEKEETPTKKVGDTMEEEARSVDASYGKSEPYIDEDDSVYDDLDTDDKASKQVASRASREPSAGRAHAEDDEVNQDPPARSRSHSSTFSRTDKRASPRRKSGSERTRVPTHNDDAAKTAELKRVLEKLLDVNENMSDSRGFYPDQLRETLDMAPRLWEEIYDGANIVPNAANRLYRSRVRRLISYIEKRLGLPSSYRGQGRWSGGAGSSNGNGAPWEDRGDRPSDRGWYGARRREEEDRGGRDGDAGHYGNPQPPRGGDRFVEEKAVEEPVEKQMECYEPTPFVAIKNLSRLVAFCVDFVSFFFFCILWNGSSFGLVCGVSSSIFVRTFFGMDWW